MRAEAGMAATMALVAALCGCRGRGSAGAADLPDSTRIARIERGLLPTIAIRGGRETPYALLDRLRRYGVPGVSIAVIDRGRLAWARAYGVSEEGGAQGVDTTTLFQAGSISKAITAVAALRLVERGVLRLDEDVAARLVSWKIPSNDRTREKPVTLRGLLSHGAGFNVPSFRGYAVDAPLPTIVQVLEGAPPANTPPIRMEIAPGTEWRYSGGGFTVVQQLLADVTNRAFADLLQNEVFDPAGMTRSVGSEPLAAALAASAATGHSGGRPVAGRWRAHPEIAAAGTWSTAPDLARLGVALSRAIRGEHGAILGAAIAREMATRQIGDWGLGLALGPASGDSATVGHDGSTAGFTARLLVLPATGQGIAVMTNGESEALIDEITRAVAREYAWPVRPRVERTVADVAPSDALAGRYRVELGDRNVDFTVSVVGDGSDRRLQITGPNGRPAELLPLSELRFFSQDTGNEFAFTRDGRVVTEMRIDQQGQSFTARRLR